MKWRTISSLTPSLVGQIVMQRTPPPGREQCSFDRLQDSMDRALMPYQPNVVLVPGPRRFVRVEEFDCRPGAVRWP